MKRFLNLKLLTIMGWSFMVLSSLIFSAYNQYQHSYNLAYDVANANFDKD